MGRAPCCDKVGLKKGPWTPDEDEKLIVYIKEHGHGSWRALPKQAGLLRCGKSCRLRWTNYLRPDIKRGKFSSDEEQTIIQFHAILGNRWSAIAAHLPGRTDNEIKNYWNTHLKKRLVHMGIDPVTHKPKHNYACEDAALNNYLPPSCTSACNSSSSSSSSSTNLMADSHMAQWQSARLEAEARLAQEHRQRSKQLREAAVAAATAAAAAAAADRGGASLSSPPSALLSPHSNSSSSLSSPPSRINNVKSESPESTNTTVTSRSSGSSSSSTTTSRFLPNAYNMLPALDSTMVSPDFFLRAASDSRAAPIDAFSRSAPVQAAVGSSCIASRFSAPGSSHSTAPNYPYCRLDFTCIPDNRTSWELPASNNHHISRQLGSFSSFPYSSTCRSSSCGSSTSMTIPGSCCLHSNAGGIDYLTTSVRVGGQFPLDCIAAPAGPDAPVLDAFSGFCADHFSLSGYTASPLITSPSESSFVGGCFPWTACMPFDEAPFLDHDDDDPTASDSTSNSAPEASSRADKDSSHVARTSNLIAEGDQAGTDHHALKFDDAAPAQCMGKADELITSKSSEYTSAAVVWKDDVDMLMGNNHVKKENKDEELILSSEIPSYADGAEPMMLDFDGIKEKEAEEGRTCSRGGTAAFSYNTNGEEAEGMSSRTIIIVDEDIQVKGVGGVGTEINPSSSPSASASTPPGESCNDSLVKCERQIQAAADETKEMLTVECISTDCAMKTVKEEGVGGDQDKICMLATQEQQGQVSYIAAGALKFAEKGSMNSSSGSSHGQALAFSIDTIVDPTTTTPNIIREHKDPNSPFAGLFQMADYDITDGNDEDVQHNSGDQLLVGLIDVHRSSASDCTNPNSSLNLTKAATTSPSSSSTQQLPLINWPPPAPMIMSIDPSCSAADIGDYWNNLMTEAKPS